MTADTAAALLQRAHSGIRQALAEWDAAHLDRIEHSRNLLEIATGEMRTFEAALRSGEILPTKELASQLQAVRHDIVQATRLVDACVAFHRGLAAQAGQSGGGYTAQGHLAGDSGDMAPEVLA